MKILKRLAPYSFVITILWFGFVFALGFIETPLRFQPERISTDEALAIGRLVFHALNAAEILFASIIVVASRLAKPKPKKEIHLQGYLVGMLIVQTGILYLLLDPRVDSILNGEEVPDAIYHVVYIGLDVVKLVLLAWLAVKQIRWFETTIRNF